MAGQSWLWLLSKPPLPVVKTKEGALEEDERPGPRLGRGLHLRMGVCFGTRANRIADGLSAWEEGEAFIHATPRSLPAAPGYMGEASPFHQGLGEEEHSGKNEIKIFAAEASQGPRSPPPYLWRGAGAVGEGQRRPWKCGQDPRPPRDPLGHLATFLGEDLQASGPLLRSSSLARVKVGWLVGFGHFFPCKFYNCPQISHCVKEETEVQEAWFATSKMAVASLVCISLLCRWRLSGGPSRERQASKAVATGWEEEWSPSLPGGCGWALLPSLGVRPPGNSISRATSPQRPCRPETSFPFVGIRVGWRRRDPGDEVPGLGWPGRVP